MGIDARGLAIWSEAVSDKLKCQISTFATDYCKYSNPKWRSDREMEIDFGCDRYFGPGYERSSNALNQSRLMRFLINAGARVYYGGDSSTYAMLVSLEYLDRMDYVFFYKFIHELEYYKGNIPASLWDGVECDEAIEYYPEDRS